MKRSNHLLNIEKPCSESWAAMSPISSGRFCASCAKNVTDFTKLSDEQVLAILSKSSENSCGRFGQSQMNRYLVSKGEPSNKSGFYKFFAGLFLLTAANQSLAKTRIDKNTTTEQRRELTSEPGRNSEVNSRQNSADSLDAVFRGRVVYFVDQSPISGVSVALEDHEIQTVTDKDGQFELTIPSDLLKESNTFVASFIGFETKAITVSINDLPIEKNIILSEDPALSEVVVVGSYAVHKRKWWQFWRKKYCN